LQQNCAPADPQSDYPHPLAFKEFDVIRNSLRCRETAFRQLRQLRVKPLTASDNRFRRPTAFAQSRHAAVIRGQFGKSPFDRECVVADAVAVEPVS
jgi:hypothetical protein